MSIPMTASTAATTKLAVAGAGSPSSTERAAPGGAFAAVLQGTLDNQSPSTATGETSATDASGVSNAGDVGGDVANAETGILAPAAETIVVPALFTQAALPVDHSASGLGLDETATPANGAGSGALSSVTSSLDFASLGSAAGAAAASAGVTGAGGGALPIVSPVADAAPVLTVAAPDADSVAAASVATTAAAAVSVAATPAAGIAVPAGVRAGTNAGTTSGTAGLPTAVATTTAAVSIGTVSTGTGASVATVAASGTDAPGAPEATTIDSTMPSSTGAPVHGGRNTDAIAALGASTTAMAAPVNTLSDFATASASGLNPAATDAAVDAAPVAASAPAGQISPAPPATPIAPAAPAASVTPTQPVPLAPQVAAPLFTLIGAKPGEHVLTINVTPDNLGPVTVRAHVSADNVRVELFAPNDAGRDALRAILPDLRRDLAGSGLNANLDLSSENQAPDSEAPVPDAQRERRSTDGDPTADQPTDAQPRGFGSSSLIDVLA